MQNEAYEKAITTLLHRDTRYPREAYRIVTEAIQELLRRQEEKVRNKKATSRSINSKELAEGLREIFLEQYGPFAYTILDTLNIHTTEDFGALVFNLIEVNVFGKSEGDAPEDFIRLYDFTEAFVAPFDIKAT